MYKKKYILASIGDVTTYILTCFDGVKELPSIELN